MTLGLALVGLGLGVYGALKLFGRYTLPFPPGTSYRITSLVGPRISPIDGTPVNHDGVDLGAPAGTEVRSVCHGTVHAVYYSASGGNVVEVEEMGRPIRWLYLHLSSSIPASRKGSHIMKGEALGYVGSTGRSTGPHLHLEANDADGRVLDPIALGVPL